MAEFRTAFFGTFKTPTRRTVTQWADDERILASKGSAEPGRYRSSRTPYMTEPMNHLSVHSAIQELILMAGAQLGKSESGNNWLGYIITEAPGPVLLVQPTIDNAKRYSKQRIAPMIAECPTLKSRVTEDVSRDGGNAMLEKEFPGGILFIGGANSAAGLRSMPIRYLFADEISAWPQEVDNQGDPLSMAEERTNTFGRKKKILKTSTPSVKGVCRIESEYLKTDQRKYFVPCVDCGHMQTLKWKNFVIPKSDAGAPSPLDAYMVCEECGSLMREHNKTDMLDRGEWRATVPENSSPTKVGYQISGLYSPVGWRSWAEIAQKWLDAQGDKEKLKSFVNNILAETWEDQAGEGQAWESLYARMEPYKIMTVPMPGLVLTAGVDVQDNRLAVSIKAWGVGEESWLVYWTEIYGDPATDAPWSELDDLRRLDFEHASGQTMRITATAVDSGGHHTQRVYAYARARKDENVIAIKGSSTAGQPVRGKPSKVDLDHKGRQIKDGAEVWYVGTDTAKGLIYSRMRVTDGPGKMHFPIGLDETYFRGLTAEKRVTKLHKGFPRQEWVKTYTRNEPLDCEVYALAAAYHAGIQRANWARLTERFVSVQSLETPQEVSKNVEEPAEVQEPKKPAPDRRTSNTQARRGGGWATNWKPRY